MMSEPRENFIPFKNMSRDTLRVNDSSYKEFREVMERGKKEDRKLYVDAGKMIRGNDILQRRIAKKELIELSDGLLSIIEENKGGVGDKS